MEEAAAAAPAALEIEAPNEKCEAPYVVAQGQMAVQWKCAQASLDTHENPSAKGLVRRYNSRCRSEVREGQLGRQGKQGKKPLHVRGLDSENSLKLQTVTHSSLRQSRPPKAAKDLRTPPATPRYR